MTNFTDLQPEKQWTAMFLPSEGEAQESVLELEEDVISGKDDVKIILAWLEKLYKKDNTLLKFQALEAFETYKRARNTSIIEHINDFEKCLHKEKNYGTQMSHVLASWRCQCTAKRRTADQSYN